MIPNRTHAIDLPMQIGIALVTAIPAIFVSAVYFLFHVDTLIHIDKNSKGNVRFHPLALAHRFPAPESYNSFKQILRDINTPIMRRLPITGCYFMGDNPVSKRKSP